MPRQSIRSRPFPPQWNFLPNNCFATARLIARVWLVGIACIATGLRGQEFGRNDDLKRQLSQRRVLESRARYDRHRQALVQDAETTRFDATTRAGLTEVEKKGNSILIAIRDQEIADYKKNSNFPAGHSFYAGRSAIESSRIFAILQKMPKGGALHVHSSSAGRVATFLQACNRPECIVEWQDDGQGGRRLTGRLGFIPPGSAMPANYESATSARAAIGEEQFARQLTSQLTLDAADAQSADVWQKFGAIFSPVSSALNYEPVFDEYFLDAFRILAADHVDYVELRAGLGHVADLEGKKTPMIDKYFALRERVRKEIPGFDFKLIISVWRGAASNSAAGEASAVATVKEALQEAMAMRQRYPDFVVGFDLVGEEDGGGTTYSYLDVWLGLPALQKQFEVDMPFYFHDGESDWPDDENLLDAYLLGCRRIGHGLNLHVFPSLEKRFVERDVALEVCPLSNQILGYVSDLRGHPASGYLRRGVPVVISSDDPAIFNYEGLSYDYWMAVMAWELDLASLKQLALNSISYSAMSPEEKRLAFCRWQPQWDAFVRDLVAKEASQTP